MTNVVKIAKDRRAKLAAEVAKLDEFLRMAEILVKLSRGGSGAVLVNTGELASGKPSVQHGSAASVPDDRGETPPLLAAVQPTEMGKGTAESGAAQVLFHFNPMQRAAPARPTEPTPAKPDQFLFNDKPAEDEAELLLSNPLPKEEAVLDVRIGQKLRQRRWMLGMSGEQLGEIIGVGLSQIKAYETGSVHIGSSRMWEIASALEVPMSYFFEDIEGQAADTGEARGEILTEQEALVQVHGAPEIRAARAS